ncbi:glucose-6-phosphate dehydrogenase assembly protein OpcA [Corynebacterium gallinarum]|uniref:Glucose-6-phosphate dehydrogenase assembly protein OpcA n=1 Tax=Corynebacterium gallinarum TaxID=2762214 RepID=A0A8I0HEK8_9CORY|nr:glucose-6-phosphate dehydrogenase assembly protein OpcA [Corynebacterium gallinarum]MBD8030371.1 glucose-6-phosphate dehydrogenase assembly protein OpcA [Corynebacterium gallinarum]
MIFELPDTSTHEIAKTLSRLRESGTQVTTGRVLTLIVVARSDNDVQAITESTNEASREHPSRVIVLVVGSRAAEPKVDAEVRIGGDAGAAEMIIMHLSGPVAGNLQSVVTPLLLPDTPIVVWWPTDAPANPSTNAIGKIAQRRITDAMHGGGEALEDRVENYHPGDTDMTWARLTQWRGLVASSLDHPPHGEVVSARVEGPSTSVSVDLAAGWLAGRLQVPVTRVATNEPTVPCDEDGTPMLAVRRVEIERTTGTVIINIQDAHTLRVEITDSDVPPALVAIGRRSEADCLSEELRHMDPDMGYQHALAGLSQVKRVYEER